MKQPPLFQICKQKLSTPCLVYAPHISGLVPLHPASSSMSVFHPIPLMFCWYTHGFTHAAERLQCAAPKGSNIDEETIRLQMMHKQIIIPYH